VLFGVYVNVFPTIPVAVMFPGIVCGTPLAVIVAVVGFGVVVVTAVEKLFVVPNVPVYVAPLY